MAMEYPSPESLPGDETSDDNETGSESNQDESDPGTPGSLPGESPYVFRSQILSSAITDPANTIDSQLRQKLVSEPDETCKGPSRETKFCLSGDPTSDLKLGSGRVYLSPPTIEDNEDDDEDRERQYDYKSWRYQASLSIKTTKQFDNQRQSEFSEGALASLISDLLSIEDCPIDGEPDKSQHMLRLVKTTTRNEEKVETYVGHLGEYRFIVRPVETKDVEEEEVEANCDIVVTHTASREPRTNTVQEEVQSEVTSENDTGYQESEGAMEL